MPKVKLKDQLGRVIRVGETTAPGATVGKDLRWPSGAVVNESDIRNPASGPNNGTAATVWKLIREIPKNISALAGLEGVGFPTRRADGSWVQRTLTGRANEISVTAGNGSDASPEIGLADLADSGTGAALRKITRDAKGRLSGTSAATTTDLSEGTNLYFTNTRADTRADGRITAQKGQPNGLATLGADGKVPAGQLPTSSSGVTSVNARTGVVSVPDFVSKATAPTSTDYGRALVNGDRWRNTNNGVLYTYQDGAWLYDNAASLSRYVPAYLRTGASTPIPLNADGTVPAYLRNGTPSNIPMQA